MDLHAVALAAAGAGDTVLARGDLLELGEDLVHDDAVGKGSGVVALLALLGRRERELLHLVLDGVVLADEAAEHFRIGAGKADATPVQELVGAALRQMLLAAHAARHTQAEFIFLRLDGQAGFAALAAHNRARGAQGKHASLLDDALVARGAEIADGTHFFFHSISSRKVKYHMVI